MVLDSLLHIIVVIDVDDLHFPKNRCQRTSFSFNGNGNQVGNETPTPTTTGLSTGYDVSKIRFHGTNNKRTSSTVNVVHNAALFFHENEYNKRIHKCFISSIKAIIIHGVR